MSRFTFTNTNRPIQGDVVMLCVNNTGHIYCGVVYYGYEGDLTVSMFVNEKETSATVTIDDIRWWSYMPITKKELWGNGGKL